MVQPTPIRGRLAELLADEATGDAAPAEHGELQVLLRETVAPDRDQLVKAAGIAQLAFLHQDKRAGAPLPRALREQLARQGAAWQAGRATEHRASVTPIRRSDEPMTSVAAPNPARRSFRDYGWPVAAALALVLAGSLLAPRPGSAPVSAAADHAVLLRAAGTATLRWAASAEPGYAAAGGNVTWNTAEQRGYLRLTGLPVNDPDVAQYQLWIVDPERDTRPVDGGVFDVTSTGEVLIAVTPRLPVGRPQLFAITLEKPGGVVVSDGPMLLTASL